MLRQKGELGQSFTIQIDMGITLTGATLTMAWRRTLRDGTTSTGSSTATIFSNPDPTWAELKFADTTNDKEAIWTFQATATFAGSPTRVEKSKLCYLEIGPGV